MRWRGPGSRTASKEGPAGITDFGYSGAGAGDGSVADVSGGAPGAEGIGELDRWDGRRGHWRHRGKAINGGYLTDEVRFHLGRDASATKLDGDIGKAFTMVEALAGRQQQQNRLNASDDIDPGLNFWRENDWFVGWLKALRSLSDPPTEVVSVRTFPSYYGRPAEVVWAVSGERSTDAP